MGDTKGVIDRINEKCTDPNKFAIIRTKCDEGLSCVNTGKVLGFSCKLKYVTTSFLLVHLQFMRNCINQSALQFETKLVMEKQAAQVLKIQVVVHHIFNLIRNRE